MQELQRRLHLMEFWPYLSGLGPEEVRIVLKNELTALSPTALFQGLTTVVPAVATPEIQADVVRVWDEGRAKNPKMSDNPKPNMQVISDDGRTIFGNFSNYQSSFWIKNRLTEHPLETQLAVARQFPFFNVGLVTVTSDDRLLVEQRPEGVTASGMLLTYPCGYASRGDVTLADVANSQFRGELSFHSLNADTPLEHSDGRPIRTAIRHPYVKSVSSIGMQRESDEWTPNYAFLMELSVPFSDVRPTKETKHILSLPADPAEIADRVVGL